MNYRMIPFRPDHHFTLTEGGRCVGGQLEFDRATLKLMATHPSWTLLADEQPVCSGGVLPFWPRRYMAWAHLNENTAQHMLAITRASRKVLDLVDGRIEITVREDFAAGHKWARLLGFEIETPLLKRFGPDGEDHVGYVRFNGVK